MSDLLKKRIWGAVFISVCLLILIITGIYSGAGKAREEQKISDALEDNDAKKLICVYVDGEVKNPGEYKLKEDSRVGDAIEAAGGFTENANKKLNIAVKLKNGGKITVMKNGEDANAGIDFKVNINTAGAEELMTIEKIGEKTAEKIIEYREKVGKFSKPEDIKNVKGIGDATYEKIKNIIVTE